MVIIITEHAKNDLRGFIYKARYGTKDTAKKYINSIICKIDNLCIFPKRGKLIFRKNKFEIRQLIVKKHKVIYSILNDEKILIMAVLHCKMNVNEYLDKLKNFF